MQSYDYPHFPDYASNFHFALFTNVSNAADLRNRLVQASTMQGEEGEAERQAVDFAFIEATLICSSLHLRSAILNSVLSQSQGTLRTKTVHSEILWNLNPTNNISDAIRRYGVSPSTTSLIVVRIGPPSPPSTIQAQMQEVVSGTLSPISELKNITDWAKVRKYHKIGQKMDKDPIKDTQKAHEIVLSTVAMKSVVV
ncbi:hypothetical protein QCA50_013730 [Cerrena zonata]|uniref:EKC/KEOPS complex subunit CGI121 n=1 Tax=Cerrena zonata TaxID=2478898 RepID=A0AAW0FZH3_9APHY